MKRILLICILLVIANSVVFAETGEKIVLKNKFELGQVYRYHEVSSETITQSLPEESQSGTVKTDTDFIYVFRPVTEYPDGSFVVEMSFEKIFLKQDGPNTKRNFNTEDPSSNVTLMDLPLVILISQNCEIRLFPNGEVKVVKGYQNFIKGFLKNFDFSSFPAGTKKFVEKLCEDSLGDQVLEEMFMNDLFPDRPVGVGDTWEIENAYSGNFPLISKAVFTLKERQNGMATIHGNAKLTANLDAKPPFVFGNYAMKFDFTGQERSITEIYEANGMLKNSRTEQELTGQMVAVKGPKDFKDQKWLFHLKSTTTVEYMPGNQN